MNKLKSLSGGNFLYSSESVTEGQPDKMCDVICDTLLDAYLNQDPDTKANLQALAKNNMIIISGEVNSQAKLNPEQLVRDRIKDLGYNDDKKGLNYSTCDVIISISQHSSEINSLLYKDKKDEDLVASDQGVVFGYATDETPELMPQSHLLASKITEKINELRRNKGLEQIRPDCKALVTLEYSTDGKGVVPVRVHSIVLSIQHDPEYKGEELKNTMIEGLIKPIIPKELLDNNTQYLINPSGLFVTGSTESNTGISGKKAISDTYGGWGSFGGSSLSGKDSSKIDRSGSYAARWVAKSLVSAGLCRRVSVQLTYVIGLAEPIAININSFGSCLKDKTDKDLLDIVIANFDLRPSAIVKELGLKKAIYKKVSSNCHFGRTDAEFSWEVPKKLNY